MIYTSGSSGQPKGVEVAHGSVAALVADGAYAPLGAGDVVAQAGSFSFDVQTFELLHALCRGASLAVVPADVLVSAERLRVWAGRYQLTAGFVTSSVFTRLVAADPDLFRSFTNLVVGGERMDPAAVAGLGRWPERLVNGYGPTECARVSRCGTL